MRTLSTHGGIRFAAGLLFALSLVYTALEWKTLVATLNLREDYEPEAALLWEELPPALKESSGPVALKKLPVPREPDKILMVDDIGIESETFEEVTSDSLVVSSIAYEEEPEAIPLGPYIQRWPVFPGCEEAENLQRCFQEKMNRHIRRNLRLHDDFGLGTGEVKVYVRFEIDQQGRVLRIEGSSSNERLTAEVERVFQTLPEMQPAVQGNRSVGVYYTIPIRVYLQ